MKEVIDRLHKVGTVLGGPDLVGEPQDFGSAGVVPERIGRGGQPAGVETGVQVDAVPGGAEHFGCVGGDGGAVGGRGGGRKAVAAAVPVLDLLETGVLEERGGQVVTGSLRRDAAAELDTDGDVGGRHVGLLGAGCWAWGQGQVAELGGDAAALGLQVEGVAVGVVDAAVLAGEGGHDVHQAGLVAHGDPPAGVRIAVRGDAGGRHHPAGHLGPLRVGQVGVPGVGADRADPHRPLGRAGPEALDGCVEGVGEVRQRVGLGEHLRSGRRGRPRRSGGGWCGCRARLARTDT